MPLIFQLPRGLYGFAAMYMVAPFGEVPERLNGTDSKSVIRLITVSGVRIPPSPPTFSRKYFFVWRFRVLVFDRLQKR
jgi:hypothetical protein